MPWVPSRVISLLTKSEGTLALKRVGPLDAIYHAALSQTLDEWESAEDEEAFRNL